MSWKYLFKGNILENFGWNYYHQKPETNHEAWYVNEKFLLMMIDYNSLKKSRKDLFNGNVFENVDWNYYHQNPRTRYLSMKKFLIYMTYYMPLKKSIQL